MACKEFSVTYDEQKRINEACERLRREVALHLWAHEFTDHGAQVPDKDTLAYLMEQTVQLDVDTSSMRYLFRDADEYRRELGMFPGACTMADLRFCASKRIGAFHRDRYLGWLPKKEDADLRELPAFKTLAAIYKEHRTEIARGERLPGPKKKHETEAMQLVELAAKNLMRIK